MNFFWQVLNIVYHGLRFAWYIIFLCITCIGSYSQEPNLVWVDDDSTSRNEYVFFKKAVVLHTTAEKSELHVYADSRYALYVNGRYLNFGPSRSFHARPYYDTYDLSQYLTVGKNCIVFKVLSNGMETFQLYDYKGAFASWGTIRTKRKKIEIASMDWYCKRSKGYEATMPRFSFATGAIENWDLTKDMGWDSCADTLDWKTPIPLKNQSDWGSFSSRPIPKLTQEEIIAKRYEKAYYLKDDESIHSFRVPTPDVDLIAYNTPVPALGYTYIYSPKKQTVQTGLWWGRYFLNGAALKATDEGSTYRKNYRLQLNEGWNQFVVTYTIIWGSWDFYMALPKNKGLKLSIRKNQKDQEWFTAFFPKSAQENTLYTNLLGTEEITALERMFKGPWNSYSTKGNANHPVRDMVWYEPDFSNEVQDTLGTTEELTIIPNKGIALRYEMQQTQLGRFFVEGDFPEGTVIDIGFSEEKNPMNFPWLYKRYQIGAGLRFVADGVTRRFESFKPYGAKFIQLNISNTHEKVVLQKMGMVRQVYPFKTKGQFTCNDSIYGKIYEAGWRTLQLCAEDSYTDTPFRERGLYAGDMLPETLVTMVMSGDMRLAEYSLDLFQEMYREEMLRGKQNRHNDFPLITLLTADLILKYKKTPASIANYYNNYYSLLQNLLKRKSEKGLIHTERVFLEWTAINKEDAYMTAYQALMVKSLEILRDWAVILGKKGDARYLESERVALKKAINTHLWDEEHGRYTDGLKEGRILDDIHLTSSIWPCLYGVSSAQQTEQVIDYLSEALKDIGDEHRKRKITPYSAYYLLELLYQNNKVAMAERFIKEHWSPMALHSPYPTTWENFDIDGNQGTSSHAWSGHPTYFLATQTLGVAINTTDFIPSDTVLIAPRSEDLLWARGSVAHPLGTIDVSWEIVGEELRLNYSLPDGVRAIIKPKGKLANLKLVARQGGH